MSNKYWRENDKGAWYLYFNPYDELGSEESIIFRMVEDSESDNWWNYSSELLKVEEDCFYAESLEEAKETAEDMIEEHYQDVICYYEELIRKWHE